jgi:hypothetical protein
MKIPLKFAELHNPLFLGGTNLGNKLITEKRPLTLVYEREWKELHVTHNGKFAILPIEAVASMEPIDTAMFGLGNIEPKIKPNPEPKVIKAQVGAPQGIKI